MEPRGALTPKSYLNNLRKNKRYSGGMFGRASTWLQGPGAVSQGNVGW